MIGKLSTQKYLPWLIFIAVLAFYLFNAAQTSVYMLDEAKNAECAREMFERGDWIVPTFNQDLRTDKPPLHYYFMMVAYAVFGVTPFSARFFSALFGALTIVAIYRFTRRFGGARPALLSALVPLAAITFGIQFQLATPDPFVVFFVSAAGFSFFSFLADEKPVRLLYLYGSLGLGILAKGPVAVALPGLVFLLFLIFNRQLNWQTIGKLKPVWGGLLVLLISLPWFAAVHLKTDGAWTEGFFLEHNLRRFTSEFEGHGGTFLAPVLFVFLGLFPFSVFLPQALKTAWTNRNNPLDLFCLLAAFTITGFFMFSQTRLPSYTVPALPFLSVLLGRWLDRVWDNPQKLTTGLWIAAALFVALVPALYAALSADESLKSIRLTAFFFVPVPLMTMVALVAARNRKTAKAVAAAGLSGVAAIVICFALAYPKADRMNPVAQSIGLIEGKEVRYFNRFNAAFVFALQHEIPPVTEAELPAFFDRYPQGVVISTQKQIRDLELPPGVEVSFAAKDLFERPTTVLLTRKMK